MKKIALLIIITLISIKSYAAFEDNSYGARMNSLSGAFVAVADSSESIFVQPAGLSNIVIPSISLSYGRLYWGLDDGSNITNTIMSVVWPLPEKYSFGVGYKDLGIRHVYKESSLVGSMSYRYSNQISFGVSAKRLSVSYGSDLYTINDPVFAKSSKKSAWDMDLGVFYSPLPFVNISACRQNVLGANIGVDETIELPSVTRMGVMYSEETFKTSIERVRQNNRNRYLFGVEKLFLKDMIAFRFGAGWGDNEFRLLSTGFGLNLKQFTMDYSLSYPLDGIEQVSGTHYITINMPMLRFQEKLRKKRELKRKLRLEKNKGKKTFLERLGAKVKRLVKKDKAQKIAKSEDAVFLAPNQIVKALKVVSPLEPKIAYPVTKSSSTLSLDPIRFDVATKNKEDGKEKTVGEAKNDEAKAKELLLPGMKAPVKKDLTADVSKTKKAVSKGNKEKPTPAKKEELELKSGAGTGKEGFVGPLPAPKPVPKVKRPRKPKKKAVIGVRNYRVKSGDTLPSLAEKYYKDKSKWMKIYKANEDSIEKGN